MPQLRIADQTDASAHMPGRMLGGCLGGPPTLRESTLRESLRALQASPRHGSIRAVGLAVCCIGVDTHPHLEFDVDDPALRNKVGTLYVQEMARRGCHGYTSFYTNAAQGDAEIEQTADAAREVFTLIGEALDAGQVDDRLEAQERKEFFRRLVT